MPFILEKPQLSPHPDNIHVAKLGRLKRPKQ